MFSKFLKFVDSFVGPLACTAMSRPQAGAERRTLTDTEGAILVIRPGGMGDAVMSLPMLTALRAIAPDRRIDIICESRNEAVFKLAFPDCVTVCYDRAPFKTIAALRKNNYACVIDTEQFHNFSGVMTALTRAPLRIGFKINTNRRGLYTHSVGYDLDGSEDAQFGRLLNAACGGAVTLPRKFGILRIAENEDTQPYLAIHAGGSIASKRCAAETLAEAAIEAAAKHGLSITIIGGKNDAAYAAQIALELDKQKNLRHTNRCGKTSLTETASICAGARLLLGPDSGVAHLAVAVGTPAVVLFGPSDPKKWAPPTGAGKAVRVELPCSPCSIFGYTKPCANHECVNGITAKMITEATETVLEES